MDIATKQKQPQGFQIFFLTEMWERYGFYVLQSLLVFYAFEKLKLADSSTYTILGSFTALAYINSVFGGVISDKLLGYRYSILTGNSLLIIGYTCLTAHSFKTFMLGLAIISVGTGMLKPNVSSMLSTLYKKEQSALKDIGYTLFYLGIYCGAFSGSFLGGYIRQHFGWSSVFISATIGLLIAFNTFLWGSKKYNLHDNREIKITLTKIIMATLFIISLITLALFTLIYEQLSDILFIVLAVGVVGFIIIQSRKFSTPEKKKILAFSILILTAVFYWAVYFQQFFSVSLCTARAAALSMPVSSLTSFETIGVIIFTPVVAWIFKFLYSKNITVSLTAKFSISFLFNAISFCVLVISLIYASKYSTHQQQEAIIASYLIIAFGELFLAPISLSMVSTLCPKSIHGAMMGVSLMSIGFGGKLAGLLAKYSSMDNVEHMRLVDIELTYAHSFTHYLWISLVMFIISLALIKPINVLCKE